MHRKLVHPSLNHVVHDRRNIDSGGPPASRPAPRRERRAGNPRNGRSSPPVRTHAEEFYYVKQMNLHTPLGVVLESGEVLRGTIDWYDRDTIHFVPEEGRSRLMFKRTVRYLYKLEEE